MSDTAITQICVTAIAVAYFIWGRRGADDRPSRTGRKGSEDHAEVHDEGREA